MNSRRNQISSSDEEDNDFRDASSFYEEASAESFYHKVGDEEFIEAMSSTVPKIIA